MKAPYFTDTHKSVFQAWTERIPFQISLRARKPRYYGTKEHLYKTVIALNWKNGLSYKIEKGTGRVVPMIITSLDATGTFRGSNFGLIAPGAIECMQLRTRLKN